jgi:hypothetical protein
VLGDASIIAGDFTNRWPKSYFTASERLRTVVPACSLACLLVCNRLLDIVLLSGPLKLQGRCDSRALTEQVVSNRHY